MCWSRWCVGKQTMPMITRSDEEYEALALRLAAEPSLLRVLRGSS
jgi:hypothetical protein